MKSKEKWQAIVAMADEAIENEDTIAYDVASELGRSLSDIKNRHWFRMAVAKKIEEVGI